MRCWRPAQDVVYNSHNELIDTNTFFVAMDQSLVTALVVAVRPLVMPAKEQVMVEGTIGTEMYLLHSGAVDCFRGCRSTASIIMQLAGGSYFGEVPTDPLLHTLREAGRARRPNPRSLGGPSNTGARHHVSTSHH